VAPERTVARWAASCRAEQERSREAAEAEQRRIRGLEAVGRGLGSVQIGAAGASEILRASVPDWRERQAVILRDLLHQFLERPTGDLYSGLAVGMHAFLLSSMLSEAVGEKPHA